MAARQNLRKRMNRLHRAERACAPGDPRRDEIAAQWARLDARRVKLKAK